MIFYIIILIVFFLIIKIVVQPYLKLRSIKQKYKENVWTFFFPFLGVNKLLLNEKSKNPPYDAFAKYLVEGNKDPKNPIKFCATNFQNSMYYYITDAQMSKEFLNDKVALYDKMSDQTILDKIFVKGMLSVNGNVHKKQRRIVANFFHFEALEKRITPINFYAQKLISQIKDFNQQKSSVNFEVASHMRKYTGNIISQIFFGEKFVKNTIDGESITNSIYEAINEAVFANMTIPLVHLRKLVLGTTSMENIPKFLVSGKEQQIRAKVEKIRQLIQGEIEERMKTFEEFEKQNNNDFIQIHLREYYTPENQKLDDSNPLKITIETILQQYFTFFFAGMDTTATFLTSSMYFLGQYPEIQERIRNQINQEIQDPENISLKQLKSLKILENFGYEVIRLMGVVPSLMPRIANCDHKLGDLEISKGDFVNFNLYGNGNNPIHFPEPLKFDLTKWEDENFQKNLNPFAFIPFSSGPRNCIGQHLAKIEYKVAIIHLLKNFRIIRDEKIEYIVEGKLLNFLKDDKIVKFQQL